jgi:hypothetical protein
MTNKIRDVISNRCLPAKVKSQRLQSPQRKPEPILGLRRMFS